jgi:hypothetical protein
MLEIVHDVAPDADLVFQSSGDVTSHVNALNGLVAAGANVITEDKAYDGEPAFQHGIAATTADNIALAGVPVHATAGNLGTSHTARVVATGTGQGPTAWRSRRHPGGSSRSTTSSPSPGGDTTFDATWAGGAQIVLQWSEPRAIFPTVGQAGSRSQPLRLIRPRRSASWPARRRRRTGRATRSSSSSIPRRPTTRSRRTPA